MSKRKRVWAWPAEEAWFLIVVLSICAWCAGGWRGLALMLGFFTFTSIIGNLMLPAYTNQGE